MTVSPFFNPALAAFPEAFCTKFVYISASEVLKNHAGMCSLPHQDFMMHDAEGTMHGSSHSCSDKKDQAEWRAQGLTVASRALYLDYSDCLAPSLSGHLPWP